MDLITSPIVLPSLVFLSVATLLLAIGNWVSGHDERIHHRFASFNNGRSDGDRYKVQYRGMLRLLIPRLPDQFAEALLPNDETTRTRLQAQLIQGGIYSTSALTTYFTVKLLLTVAPPLVSFLLGAFGFMPPAIALFAGGLTGTLGMLLPGFWLARRRAHRHSLLRRSLPDFLDLIVTCLEGGLSMPGSLKQVTDELRLAHPLLAGELEVVLREMELGRPLEQALARLAERTGLEELRSMGTFVQQATKFGTAMAEAMRQLAEMLRQQREHRVEELAQKAAVKILFPTLLFIFPTVFVVLAGPAAIQIKERLTDANKKESSPTASR